MAGPDATTVSRAAAPAAGDDPDVRPGDRVDRYVLRRLVGEGGFAVVFVAEQDEPVRRRVAVKIIKAGMDTKQVIARFEAERQALALMTHPHVARVFDAGTTPGGRPYFAMEYVPGESITEYCDRHRLSLRERLGLFVQACEAVQHAHQKGIIHRDLKPSNVLVTVSEGTPVVKVIDFGVAKAVSLRLTEKTLYTEQGQLIGTPAYMSPEQAEMTGLDVDSRTDIYSLGVLLYELLVGALPFDVSRVRWSGLAGIQRLIREEEPETPSVRLATLGGKAARVASHRRGDVRGLLREIRGDLDWVTMKAMDKDRTRRYSSASELAADVHRHLADVPVVAGPPSARYWLRKFFRRHTVGAVATSVVIFALVAALIVSTALAIGQARARARAAEAAARLYETRENGAVEAERVLMAVVEILRRTDRDHPTLPVALDSLAGLYLSHQRPEEAEAALASAVRSAGRALPENDPFQGALLVRHGRVLASLGRYEDAEAALLEARGVYAAEPPAPEDLDRLRSALADLYDRWDRPPPEAWSELVGTATSTAPD